MTKTIGLLTILAIGICVPCIWAASTAPLNLALPEWGAMPSASSSAPDLSVTAAKACDGKAETVWVSGTSAGEVWLEVQWQTPLEIQEILVRQSPGGRERDVAPLGKYRIERLASGQWQRVGEGDATSTPVDQPIHVPAPDCGRTRAVRLVASLAPGERIAVSEFQVLGPRPRLPWDWAPAWQGAFIWTEPSLVMPNRQPERRYFRRSFQVDEPAQIKEAWLAGCAYDRLCGIWINNRLVLHDISYNGGLSREARWAAIPIELLCKGENVIAAAVDDIYECGSHGLLAELLLVDRAGRRTLLATDRQWKGHADAGPVPEWRKPGFKDTAWVPCSIVAGANGRWQSPWRIPHPILAPQDTLEVVELSRVGQGPAMPGRDAKLRVTFNVPDKPRSDYAVAVRLGQHSFFNNHDYDLGGSVLLPEEVKTSDWTPGRHTIEMDLHLPEYSPRRVPATLWVSNPRIAAGLTSRLAECRADAYGLHFTIPVERGNQPRGDRSEGFARNEVRLFHGTPTLTIDSRPTAPILWSSAYGSYRRYHEYAATGVKLFRPLIAGSPICAPGEEEAYYPWWLAQVDAMIQAALDVDPEIRVLPALFMDPNPQMLFDDPSEQMISGRGRLAIPNMLAYPDRAQVRPTFMSPQWRRHGAEGLRRLVEHMRRQPYASRVVGLWFFAGRGGENYYGGNEFNIFYDAAGRYDARPRAQWDAGDFSAAARVTFRQFLVQKYATVDALQQAWRRKDLTFDDVLASDRFRREEICDLLCRTNAGPTSGSLRDPTEPSVGSLPMDYYQCFAEAMLDTFAAWGGAVKHASDGRLLTGCYYGYTLAQLFTAVPGFAGHTAVAKACATPELDFYASPTEYDLNRRAGGHYWGYHLLESLRLHNKLWIYEQDTRTYLADIGPKTYAREETIEVLKRDCAAALTHGAGWWWYEFAQGQAGATARPWFADPEIAAFARHVRRVYDHALTLPERGPAASIAVFYHGETHTAQDIFPPTLPLNISIGRLTLMNGMQRIGAPFDLYNLADIPELARQGRLQQYRMCLFLNPFYLTAPERQSLDLCKGGGRTLVWLWAPGLAEVGQPLSAERVASVTGIPGVRLLEEQAEPVAQLSGVDHPLLAGLPSGYSLAPRPFPPGDPWQRWGNRIGPIPWIAPDAAGPDTRILGHWVYGERLRADMGALAVRDLRRGRDDGWASIYSAVPYLSTELLRNAARLAGVHLYREKNDVLFADRQFVAIHTGSERAADMLRLPARTPVYDVFGKKLVSANADTIPLDVPPYSTALYYLGDPGKFKAAVERDP